MHDKKKMDALVAKIANGKAAGPASRAVSTAPPRPAKSKATKVKAPNPPTPNENTVIGNETKIPAPAKAKHGGMHITINIGKD